jgi:hypothetical protein
LFFFYLFCFCFYSFEANILADPYACGFGARDRYNDVDDAGAQNEQIVRELRVVLKKSSGIFFLGVEQNNDVPATFQLRILPSTSSLSQLFSDPNSHTYTHVLSS